MLIFFYTHAEMIGKYILNNNDQTIIMVFYNNFIEIKKKIFIIPFFLNVFL